MRKIYCTCLGLTIGLIGIRVLINYESLTSLWVIKEVLLSLIIAHIYLVIPFIIGMLNRAIYKAWVIDWQKMTTTFFTILICLPLIYVYVIALRVMDAPVYLIHGVPLFIAGIYMDTSMD